MRVLVELAQIQPLQISIWPPLWVCLEEWAQGNIWNRLIWKFYWERFGKKVSPGPETLIMSSIHFLRLMPPGKNLESQISSNGPPLVAQH